MNQPLKSNCWYTDQMILTVQRVDLLVDGSVLSIVKAGTDTLIEPRCGLDKMPHSRQGVACITDNLRCWEFIQG